MAYTNIQNLLEITVFEQIRLQLVAESYLPDILNTTLFPRTEAGYLSWLTAIADIPKGLQKFPIEIFNNGNPENKGEKKMPRIVIVTEDFLPGDIGYPIVDYEQISESEYRLINPQNTSLNLNMRVVLIAETALQQQTLTQILFGVMPTRGYLTLSGTTTPILFELAASFPTIDYGEGILERAYRYSIKDLYLSDGTIITSNIAPLDELRFYTKFSNGEYELLFTNPATIEL